MEWNSLRYEVDLADDVLAVTLHVTNPAEQAFDFQVRTFVIRSHSLTSFTHLVIFAVLCFVFPKLTPNARS